MSKQFVHLHVHTEYSLLDGLSKIKALISKVKENKMTSLAITDHGVLYGAIEFYKSAIKSDVKPIIGMEAYVVSGDHTMKGQAKSKNNHLVLLAKNNEGYKNLMKITSEGHLKGFYYRPRVSKEFLAANSKGLICTSACPAGELANTIVEHGYNKAREIVQWYLDVFGDDYYMEIQRHSPDVFIQPDQHPDIKRELKEMAVNENKVNSTIIRLSRELGVPMVATNDAHYINKEDAMAQDILVCISTGKKVSDIKRLRFIDTPDFYIKTPEEMYQLFDDVPEACENTVKIAEKCEVIIKLGEWFFPKMKMPAKTTPEQYLTKLAKVGLKKRYTKISKEIKKRFEYELGVIITKGYAAYFLIYWDMANWALKEKVPINTRGSVAGSIVSYVLGITTVDPIRYQLPFERFLNPFRPSAPDIDMDISDDKRQDMIAYLIDKFGSDKVAQICTFGRMLARGSVRDVARVLGYEYSFGDKIAKSIPMGSQGFPMTIDRALRESEELELLYRSDDNVKRVVDLSSQIEGNARHLSVHAAGLVISPTQMIDFSPVQFEPSGDKIITQYEMHACEDIGLVKLDVLGIRNLAILRGAVKLVKEVDGKDVDLLRLPLDDKKTFDMLSRGETMGTFQLSGSGMTRYLVDLKPESIEDIMIMVALFRPGPMANIDEYIARKHGKKKVVYYHPKMEKFLDKSLGVLVYQDDLLYTALELAGYDWLEVDKFRYAVGKKIPEEMAKQHIKFVDGCVKISGMSKNEAEGLWKLFEPFQGYGFNKAHAASYGTVAYQTAYMKANYPVEFMTALFSAESGDKDKIADAVAECRRMGIKVLPPHINQSGADFTIVKVDDSIDGKAIRFGLGAIKNVGEAAILSIISTRNESQFTSLADFISRVGARKVNKRVLESLIKAGSFDDFGVRKAMLENLEEVRNRLARNDTNSNQQGLFSSDEMSKSKVSYHLPESTSSEEFEESKLEEFERELIGYSLSAKPVSELLANYHNLASHRVKDLTDTVDSVVNIRLAVVISEIRVVVTKRNGKEMAFGRVDDGTGVMDIVVFPSVYEENKNFLEINDPLLIIGKVEKREDATSLIVESIQKNVELSDDERLFIRIPENTTSDKLKLLKKLIVGNPGESKVSLIFEGNEQKQINLKVKIKWDKDMSSRIQHILGV